MLTPHDRIIQAADAKALLDNRLFKQAFERVSDGIDALAMSCDPDNHEKAARIIISKQLLAALKREITRQIEDGEIAQFQLKEVEKRKGLMKFIR